MALGTVDPDVVVAVASLADDYADNVLTSLAESNPNLDLRQGLSGAFLSFLVDALMLCDTPVGSS